MARANAVKKTEPTYEEIAAKAYELWEQAGKPAGDGKEFWLEAEKELKK